MVMAQAVFEEGMQGWLDFLGRSASERQLPLLLNPAGVLSREFVADLGRIAAQRTYVGLFFDSFEVTGIFLEPWLARMVEGR